MGILCMRIENMRYIIPQLFSAFVFKQVDSFYVQFSEIQNAAFYTIFICLKNTRLIPGDKIYCTMHVMYRTEKEPSISCFI